MTRNTRVAPVPARAGQGPPLILVDGALCSRSFGPMPKLAEQLGSALALEAAKHIGAITRLAVYEPPFIVDGSRPPMPGVVHLSYEPAS